jgi:hypothetical protein
MTGYDYAQLLTRGAGQIRLARSRSAQGPAIHSVGATRDVLYRMGNEGRSGAPRVARPEVPPPSALPRTLTIRSLTVRRQSAPDGTFGQEVVKPRRDGSYPPCRSQHAIGFGIGTSQGQGLRWSAQQRCRGRVAGVASERGLTVQSVPGTNLSGRHQAPAEVACEFDVKRRRRRPLDGNRDGNVGSQRQSGAATGSQTLLLDRAELVIRYT